MAASSDRFSMTKPRTATGREMFLNGELKVNVKVR